MEAIDVYRNIQALSAEFATERRERQRRRELVRQCYTCRSVTSPVIEPGKNSPKLLEGPTLINTPPGMEATIDHGTPTDDMKGIAYFRSLAPAIGMTCGLFRMPSLPGRAAWTAGRPFSRSS
jgi:hypothetical protein